MTVSLAFSIIDTRLDGIVSAGISGWDLFKIAGNPNGEGPLNYLSYAPAASAVVGAAVALSSYLSLRGEGFLPNGCMGVLCLLSATMAAVMFIGMYFELSDNMVPMYRYGMEMTITPGAGTLMQIAGSLMAMASMCTRE